MDKKDEIKKETTKNNTLLLKIGIGIFIVLVIGGVLVLLLGKDNKKKNPSKEQNTTQEAKKKNDYSVKGDTLEELKNNAKEDIDYLVKELDATWKQLSEEINTFDSYMAHKDKIASFYKEIVKKSKDFTIKTRAYTLRYAEVIIHSDNSWDVKYDEIDKIYDDLYDGVLEDLYEGVYETLLDKIYDYYDQIIEEASDSVSYEQYLDISNNEYKNYLDAASDVYKEYLDSADDIHKFYLDLLEQINDKDLEKAKEVIQEFQKNLETFENEEK